jgi:hypothetical protein
MEKTKETPKDTEVKTYIKTGIPKKQGKIRT